MGFQDDNVRVTVGTSTAGANVATDFIKVGSGETAHYQYMKVAWGADGTVNLASTTSGKHLPIQLYKDGTALTATSNALDVNIKSQSINPILLVQGGTVDIGGFVHGATIPLMVSGNTAIGGAITIKGTNQPTTPVYISGIQGATQVGVTFGTNTVPIRTVTSSFAGGTFTGDVVGVTGHVSVDGGSFIGITTKDGALDTRTLTTSFAGGTFTGDVVGVTGELTTTVRALAATYVASTGVLAGDIIGVTGAVEIVEGSLVGVTSTFGGVTTGLGIRDLTFGQTAGAVSPSVFDGVIVRGITQGYPVTAMLSGPANSHGHTFVGISGDALKVAITNSGFTASITLSATQKVTNTGIAASGGFLAVSGTTGAPRAILIEGTADGVSIGIVGNMIGITANTPLAITGADGPLAVMSTNLDIRGLTVVPATANGSANNSDHIVIHGHVNAGIAGGSVTAGVTGALPTMIYSAGGTAAKFVYRYKRGELREGGDQLAVALTEASGISGADALQVQGRLAGSAGASLNPVIIRGTQGPSDSDEGFIGVTFGSYTPKVDVAGHSSESIKAYFHGFSAAPVSYHSEGGTIAPIGVSGDALKVSITDAALEVSVSVGAEVDVTPKSGTNLVIQGACVGDANTAVTIPGVFVSGTAGSYVDSPVRVMGAHPASLEAGLPVGVTSEAFHHVLGLTAALTDLLAEFKGLNGITLARTSTGDDMPTLGYELAARLDDIDEFTNFSGMRDSLGTLGTSESSVIRRINEIHGYLTNKNTNPTWTGPNVKVEVDPPSALQTENVNLATNDSSGKTVTLSNTASLKSGVKLKLSPDSSVRVYVGGPGVNVSNGYVLFPGEELFLETSQMSNVTLFANAGTVVVVYALGY